MNVRKLAARFRKLHKGAPPKILLRGSKLALRADASHMH